MEEYKGRRIEVVVWLIWGWGMFAAGIFAMLWQAGLFHRYLPPLDLGRGWLIFLPGLLCLASCRKIAQMRGCSVTVTNEALEITPYRGKTFRIELGDPIKIDHRMMITYLPYLSFTMPIPVFETVFRISQGNKEYFINLDRCENPRERAYQLYKTFVVQQTQ